MIFFIFYISGPERCPTWFGLIKLASIRSSLYLCVCLAALLSVGREEIRTELKLAQHCLIFTIPIDGNQQGNQPEKMTI